MRDQPPAVGEDPAKGGTTRRLAPAAAGIAALVLGCCGSAPFLVVSVGSLTLGAVVGVGAGVLALIALVAIVVIVRRRRGCGISTAASSPTILRAEEGVANALTAAGSE